MASVDRELTDVDPAQIRAVAFDCYGTLIDFDERAFPPAIHAMLQQYNVSHIQGKDLWDRWMESARKYARLNNRDPEHPLEGPEPPFVAFADLWLRYFEMAFKETKVHTISPETAIDYIFRLLSEAPAYPEAADVIAGLQQAGMRVAVASNADDIHLFPVLKRAQIEPEFVLSSEQVRAYKPRKLFFDAVSDRLGIPHEQILYVGDSPNADIIGANNAGMPVYWVRRYEDPHRARNLKQDPPWVYPDLRALLELLLGQPA